MGQGGQACVVGPGGRVWLKLLLRSSVWGGGVVRAAAHVL